MEEKVGALDRSKFNQMGRRGIQILFISLKTDVYMVICLSLIKVETFNHQVGCCYLL